jgi:hypothetical protein
MTATPLERPDAARPRLAHAFGLDIELSFAAPGLPERSGPATGRRTRVDLVPPAEIDRDWPAEKATRVLEETFGEEGEPARTIDADPVAGYRLYARHFGLARLTPDGGQVLCSPPDVEPWNWQRFLVGRILPWAAVLRGLEVFHASAVSLDGRAIAFVGATGAGKTSLALRLVARGARFLTDDVLALDVGADGVRAHAGAAIVAVRPAERDAIPPETWSRLGAVLGHSEKTYVAVPLEERPLPLAALYFLRPGQGSAVEPLERPDPRLLLTSTFVFGVQTPERLRNQLDVCAALASAVPMFALDVSADDGSQRLADVVERHARSTLGAAGAAL